MPKEPTQTVLQMYTTFHKEKMMSYNEYDNPDPDDNPYDDFDNEDEGTCIGCLLLGALSGAIVGFIIAWVF